jgi:hypothetical protein
MWLRMRVSSRWVLRVLHFFMWNSQMLTISLAGILTLLREGGGVALGLSRLFARHASPLPGIFVPPPSPVRAVYPVPSPVVVRRSLDGRRTNESVHTPTDDLACISLRDSFLLPLSSCRLYQNELDTFMHHPCDCGVLSAAPRCPGAVRRRDVAVPCDDYFFDFSFFAVIFTETC